MLDFRRRAKSRPRNYLGGAEQRKLLGYMLALGLTLLLIRDTAQPDRWTWLLGGEQPDAASGASRDEIDTRLDVPDGERLAGEPLIVQPTPRAAPSGEYFAGVRAEYLDAIRDDTAFRGAESDAFFHLCRALADAEPRAIESASIGPVGFAQLFRQPNEYRGRLVSVRGSIRGAFPVKASKNAFGIERFHQLWLQPAGATQQVIVVYALGVPESFPTGRGIGEEVELTGFFYKRFAYNAQDTLRTAPLLIAQGVTWRRAAPPAEAPPLSPWGIPAAIASVILGVGIVLVFVLRAGRPIARRRPLIEERFVS